MEQKNCFEELYKVDLKDKCKQKNGLSYIPWSASWAEVKKVAPDATYKIYEREDGRFWHDDGKTAWVKVSVTINDIENIEIYPIMDFKNKSMLVENITSMDALKAVQRGITKASARHGCGLFIYEGLEDTEENIELKKLQDTCLELIKKKSALSENTKKKVGTVCKSALPDCNGDPRLCEDTGLLDTLRKELMKIRKVQ